jgi:hypothetical protein
MKIKRTDSPLSPDGGEGELHGRFRGSTAWLRNPQFCRNIALALWIVPMLVIFVLVAHNPQKRTVTLVYHDASANWWARQDLYSGLDGMHYLPHFAVLFSPFHGLSLPFGDILWRGVAALLLAGGIWRLAQQQFGEGAMRAFLLASVVALPLSLPALRNGQANALFAALLLQAAAATAGAKWGRATLWMILALAVKPLGIVLVLLAPVVYSQLRWRVAVGLIALALFPFLFAETDYALAQHRSLVENLQACATVTEHRFADINGIIRSFGGELPLGGSKAIRALAAGFTLGLWYFGARRLIEPTRSLWLLTLTAAYLMLFNPMNEANSYVIIAPAFGLWTAIFFGWRPEPRIGWLIAGIALSMGCLPNLLRPFFDNGFALFWHPVMTIVSMVLLASVVWRQKWLTPASATAAPQVL